MSTSHPTPHVLLDPLRLEANVAALARAAAAVGLAVRPHAKTHKSLEIARRQLAAGAVGLTVATVSEATVFAAGGCDDLFIAYPLWVDDERASRLRRVLELATVAVGVDSVEAVGRLASLAGTGLRVRVEVDSGHHRSGVPALEAGRIASAAADSGLDVEGVFTFPGHSYAPTARATAAADEANSLAVAVESLAAVGLPSRVVSGGSTPSAAFADAGVLTELRPGVYVFGDAQQWELETMSPGDIALGVVATVVSRFGDRIVADAGSKLLGMDRAAWATGFGRVRGVPDARITALSEHHATITGLDVPVGSRIEIVPNHVCVTVNLVDEFVLPDGTTWPVDARGRNT
ncbi:MAG: alanine racemase [Janthinobacterium lividum]